MAVIKALGTLLVGVSMGEAIITGAKEGWTVAIPAGGILTTGRAGAGVVLRFQVFLSAWLTTICMIYVQSGCCI